ncbi:MAG: hypothetical protein COS99_01565 [Candidatus Omnitrophica bacterium CG07_land_8_20_14_0_80_42_15]|uniref:Uncharacterized protein n=1 Tax=Candidatus Aquitaenariimonas noxiae TaxID=1974741 RepID=A0A2J0KUL6_9BACT|nr:MAG: hypothetical protein COS99_01565 [Candidatus Omnitrophica bacterium CG07_land_8_20_14_0_80_42_15]
MVFLAFITKGLSHQNTIIEINCQEKKSKKLKKYGYLGIKGKKIQKSLDNSSFIGHTSFYPIFGT